MLRTWRQRRRYSQLDLAEQAQISPRHLSFLETGRSRPSRKMVLHLAEQLGVPLRERNELLLTAQYAPVYMESPVDAPEFTQVRAAVTDLLDSREPFPALVVDRWWNIRNANSGLDVLTSGAAEWLLAEPINLLRLLLHPDGLARRITNLAQLRDHLLDQVRRRAEHTGDEQLFALHAELQNYPRPDRPDTDMAEPKSAVIPLRISHGGMELSLFCTETSVVMPTGVITDEHTVMMFFPADRASRVALAGGRRG